MDVLTPAEAPSEPLLLSVVTWLEVCVVGEWNQPTDDRCCKERSRITGPDAGRELLQDSDGS